MTDHNMTGVGENVVEGVQAADASAPKVLANQKPLSTEPMDLDADASGNRKRERRKKAKAKLLLNDRDLLMRINWSKLRQPDVDLPELIEQGQVVFAGYDKHRSDWRAAGKPACDACKGVHAPPCMTPEEGEFVRVQRELLKAYRAEEQAVEKQAEADRKSLLSGKTTEEGRGKGKGKATAEPPSQPKNGGASGSEQAPAAADAKQDKTSSEEKKKKKKSKYNPPCPRCGGYHNSECFLTNPCDQCKQYHMPYKACPLSKTEYSVYKGALWGATNAAAGAMVGRMLSERLAPPTAKGKDKKRKAEVDPVEGSSKGATRK